MFLARYTQLNHLEYIALFTKHLVYADISDGRHALEERDVLLQGIVKIFYINKMFATGMHWDAPDFHHYLMFFKDSSGTIIVI